MLQTHGLDKYNRTLGDVFLPNGTNVNQELVKQGWWYRKYAPAERLLEGLETEARAGRKGPVADLGPTPPWVYRKAGEVRHTVSQTSCR